LHKSIIDESLEYLQIVALHTSRLHLIDHFTTSLDLTVPNLQVLRQTPSKLQSLTLFTVMKQHFSLWFRPS
jgi:hypothetical protein